ncbi:MAG TPA: DUF2075 domain-containing protein [Methanocorpusculum sp.]|nr:DUF2075 domain-containing protein [Methanocorpusculum sp.]
MLVYEGLKSDFQRDVKNGTIATEIEQKIYEKMGRHTQQNEFNSWVNSLRPMSLALEDDAIPLNAGIAIEYNIPLSAKRVDFIITGYDSNHDPEMVIIELKQWSKLEIVESTKTIVNVDEPEHQYKYEPRVKTFTGNAYRDVVHPSYQAWSYAQLIADYNETVQKQHITLKPCAYLHNYIPQMPDPLVNPQFEPFITYAPVFTITQGKELSEFIKKYIKTGDNKEVLYLVDHGKIKPSKSLQDAIASMVDGNEEFIMIDEQQVVFEKISKISKQCKSDHKKRTIICKGGPGTGKSVIAIRLLSELTQHEQFVQYVSKNSAPRQVYAAKLKGTSQKSSVYNMFKGSGSYTTTPENLIDTLLVDEAHRLNEKSGMFHNKGENQIKEIIHASKCSVFFIDERQRVTIDDIGSVAEIRKWADAEGSDVTELELVSQFRCNGSNGYLAWIDDLLEIRQSANYNLDGMDYDVRIFDTPDEVRELIVEKNKIANRARILAGYCWNWPKPMRNDSHFHDIQIGDFGISWNLEGDSTFAISETSVNEAGCIHTTQGLEFDYVGVIIGDDLRYENGHVVTDFTRRASTDQSLKGIKNLNKANPVEAKTIADEIIKNTYRTLLTRGMKGCYIYCTNPELREYIRSRIVPHPMN